MLDAEMRRDADRQARPAMGRFGGGHPHHHMP